MVRFFAQNVNQHSVNGANGITSSIPATGWASSVGIWIEPGIGRASRACRHGVEKSQEAGSVTVAVRLLGELFVRVRCALWVGWQAGREARKDQFVVCGVNCKKKKQ